MPAMAPEGGELVGVTQSGHFMWHFQLVGGQQGTKQANISWQILTKYNESTWYQSQPLRGLKGQLRPCLHFQLWLVVAEVPRPPHSSPWSC